MKKERSELDILVDISEKLDKLIGMFAIQGKDKDDQIKILISLGFTNSEASKLTGIPKGTVDTIRAKNRRK